MELTLAHIPYRSHAERSHYFFLSFSDSFHERKKLFDFHEFYSHTQRKGKFVKNENISLRTTDI